MADDTGHEDVVGDLKRAVEQMTGQTVAAQLTLAVAKALAPYVDDGDLAEATGQVMGAILQVFSGAE